MAPWQRHRAWASFARGAVACLASEMRTTAAGASEDTIVVPITKAAKATRQILLMSNFIRFLFRPETAVCVVYVAFLFCSHLNRSGGKITSPSDSKSIGVMCSISGRRRESKVKPVSERGLPHG
jgi:hypothetical protein